VRPLAEYTRKRDFKKTSEPSAKVRKGKEKNLLFVVQEHHASHLHYDFRLEWKGVLKSWAVPKGPSLDPSQKRLAVEVEDHPYEYWKFEGVIPAKEYGGGEVFRWDSGVWIPHGDVEKSLKKGHLEFELKGKKLKGNFRLIRTGRQSSKPNWLLMKRHDKYAKEGAQLVPIANYGAGKILHPNKRTVVGGRGKRKAKKKAPAPEADLPDFTPPQLAQLVTKPPKGDEWLHEVKFDGYRIQAHVAGGKVTMYTRRGHDWTDKYGAIEKALADLDVGGAVFDGEVVWQDEKGRSSFQKLQNAMKAENTSSLIYYIFDLLYLNGEDTKSLPLIERKEKLKALIEGFGHPQIKYSEHFAGIGDKMIEASCHMDLEGIVCKRADAAYVPGRHDDWVKVKCIKRQEFVIGGFTDPEGSRVAFGSLLLGVYEGDKLKFVGKCGSGFDHSLLRDINKRLRGLETDESPFSLNAPRGRGLHWVEPKLACEVKYAEMTEGGHLRVPVFQGLRSDKPPKQITIEKPKKVKGHKVVAASTAPHVSHPDRKIYEKEKLTKLDVAKYYQAVSKWILPHIADRPLSLVRCTSSATKPCFFSKHLPNKPDHVLEIPDTEGKEPWVGVNDEEGLLQLVQWGSLEIHPWGSHRENIDAPDMIVMDFDPAEDVPFSKVKEGAVEMREMLKQLGLRSFLKTTGGKGLHVVFPFEPNYDWETVKNFSHTLTQEFVSRHPDLYTGNMSKKTRKGKIFLDYLRNGRGATAVAPYSLRARERSAVAMPIEWSELSKLKAANIFTLPKALAWLEKRKKDPWKDFFRVKQSISILN
jgi:bifunctional non-homologous end joining protein LigD